MISFTLERDPEAMKQRIMDDTMEVEDQFFLLSKALDIAMGLLLSIAIETNMDLVPPEQIGEIISMMVMAAPPEERDDIRASFMALEDAEV